MVNKMQRVFVKQIHNQLATVASSCGGDANIANLHQARVALAFLWLVSYFSHMQMKGKDNKNIINITLQHGRLLLFCS